MIPRILEVSPTGTCAATTVTGPATTVASPCIPRKVHTVNAASPTGPRKHLRLMDPDKRLSLPVESLMSPPPLLSPSSANCSSAGLSAAAATQAVKKAAGSISRATIAGAKKIKTDTDTHLAIAAETALNFFPGAAVRTNTSPELQHSQLAEPKVTTTTDGSSTAPNMSRRESCRSSQRSRVTADGTCTLFVEDYKVPLIDGSGFLPMDRECRRETFSKGSQKGAVLLIPGFASNRQMFHLGGGIGKSGPSFSEFLAQREYDVFAIDLRGTTEALALGAKRAAGMREYVEVDIPSAIQMIKRLGGYKQVYLIGHSMGGALSCAVAGICPEDVAGVIHLAGLYHYTLPGLSEVIDLYKAFCPRPIKAIVRTSSSLAARSASAVLSPVISGVGYVLGVNSSAPSAAPTTARRPPTITTTAASEPAVGADNADKDAQQKSLIAAEPPRPPILHYTQQFMTHLKRQPIPLKTGLNVLLFLRQFVPERIEKALMNAMYPSPWVANSVEDPWGLMKASVESPSVGVYLSIAQMALHHEYYNNWVANSSVHRAEVASDDTDNKVTESANETSKPSSTGNLLSPPPLNARSLSSSSSTSDSSSATATSEAAPPTPTIAGLRKKRMQKASQHPDLTDEETWNELTTYLRKFESLEQLPLFFCYANADGVIRMKDSLVGYERSGSFWKDVIHYEDEVLEDPAITAAKAKAASSPNAAQATEDLADDMLREKIVDGVRESFEDCCKVLRTGCDNVGARTPAFPSAATPAAAEKTGDVDTGATPAADRKVHFSPAYDESDPASAILWASSRPPKKSMSSTALHALHRGTHHQHHHHHLQHHHHSRPPPVSKITTSQARLARTGVTGPATSTAAAAEATAATAALPSSSSSTRPATTPTARGSITGTSSGRPQTPTFKPQFPAVFSLDAGTSYGHIDVLGGVHAEVLWVCIAEWLEKTSARNRTWGFWRRYSAK
ncbi:hypothetical protein HDU86_004653 [Geranomyces michiganensis]|nr:hypothetical protein HDU86_004653 [Geranomyces michiganensis]